MITNIIVFTKYSVVYCLIVHLKNVLQFIKVLHFMVFKSASLDVLLAHRLKIKLYNKTNSCNKFMSVVLKKWTELMCFFLVKIKAMAGIQSPSPHYWAITLFIFIQWKSISFISVFQFVCILQCYMWGPHWRNPFLHKLLTKALSYIIFVYAMGLFFTP